MLEHMQRTPAAYSCCVVIRANAFFSINYLRVINLEFSHSLYRYMNEIYFQILCICIYMFIYIHTYMSIYVFMYICMRNIHISLWGNLELWTLDCFSFDLMSYCFLGATVKILVLLWSFGLWIWIILIAMHSCVITMFEIKILFSESWFYFPIAMKSQHLIHTPSLPVCSVKFEWNRGAS